jgi:hypothetical protein
VEIRQDLRSYLGRRELPNNRQRHFESELIELFVSEATTSGRTQALRAEHQLIALAHSPRFERRFRQNDPEGIPDASQRNFHG